MYVHVHTHTGTCTHTQIINVHTHTSTCTHTQIIQYTNYTCTCMYVHVGILIVVTVMKYYYDCPFILAHNKCINTIYTHLLWKESVTYEEALLCTFYHKLFPIPTPVARWLKP